MTLTEKVARLLKNKGMTQSDLADLVGVAKSRVSLWMQGTGMPNAYQTREIARALGVSMEYLTDDSLQEPPPGEGLSAKQRLLLEMVNFIPGGVNEALSRILNPAQAVRGSTAELVAKLRADDEETWTRLRGQVMPQVIEAARVKFGEKLEWIKPEERAWSGMREFENQLRGQDFDLKLETFDDLRSYLSWAAGKKCLDYLERMETDPGIPEYSALRNDESALMARLGSEALKIYTGSLDRIETIWENKEEQIITMGFLCNKEISKIADEIKQTTGEDRPPGYIRRIWPRLRKRLGKVIGDYVSGKRLS